MEDIKKTTPWSPCNIFRVYKFSLHIERFKIWETDSSLPASDRTALFFSRLDLVLISILKCKTGTAPVILGESFLLDTKVTVGLLDLIKPAVLNPSIDFLFVITEWYLLAKQNPKTHPFMWTVDEQTRLQDWASNSQSCSYIFFDYVLVWWRQPMHKSGNTTFLPAVWFLGN